jgi:hypothetical protein
VALRASTPGDQQRHRWHGQLRRQHPWRRHAAVDRSPAAPDSFYGITIGTLRCDAVPVQFDLDWWRERFLAQRPPGSPGYRSYFPRITGGSPLRPEQAARGSVKIQA